MCYSKPMELRRSRKHMSLDDGGSRFAEGVFFKLSMHAALDAAESSSMNDSATTTTSTSASCSPVSSAPTSWKSTETRSFYLHQPLVVSDPESDELVVNEAEALFHALQRSGDLPSTCHYSNNHIMVNQERKKEHMAPLTRLHELDAIARAHAEAMAARDELFHSDPGWLHEQFQRPLRRMGENVAMGANIRDIHQSMMETASDKHNILHRRYTHMGMATSKGSRSGQLYLCQVFRG